ncbi:MAG: DUF898 family protein, partial [Burkholderiaceae bacterium]
LLKGRLVALVLLVAYSQAGKISTMLWFVVVAVLIAILPWLLWRSLRFRLANSSYRGIRFRFEGSLAGAYATFIPLILMVLGPTLVLVLFSSGFAAPRVIAGKAMGAYGVAILIALLVAPWFVYRLRAYRHRHARLGASAFAFNATVGGAYRLAGMLFLTLIGVIVCSFLAGFLGGAIASLPHYESRSMMPIFVGSAVGYVALLSIYPLAAARLQNFAWNNTTLDGQSFQSRASSLTLWGIDATNLLLFIVTLGFYWPFAMMRRARYRIGSLAWFGDPDTIARSAAIANVGAAGDETADLFGFELAL